MPLDNQNEQFYWVDEKDQVLGSITRYEAHHDRTKIHRSVFIILINAHNHILLQKRSQKKDTHPGKWTVSASGHVMFGQTYEEAAHRELEEEIGVKTPLTFLKTHLFSVPNEQEFAAIYTGQYSRTPTTLDPDEVDEVRWLDTQTIGEWSQQGLLTPMATDVFQLLKYIEK